MKKFLEKLSNFSNSWTGTIIIVLLVIFFVAQAFVIPSGSMKRTLLISDYLFVKKFAYGIPTPHIPWLEIPVFPDFNDNGHLYEGDKPKRGDIVVFRYPKNIKLHYVKRCVAVGGDEILYTEKRFYLRPHEGDEYIKKNFDPKKIYKIGGKLWVLNPLIDKFPGIQYDENVDLMSILVNTTTSGRVLVLEDGTTIVHYKVPENEFFMMGDNRDHSNDSRFWGTVPYRYIVGKPWFIYFSWDDDYKIRWDRIGRFVEDMQFDKRFIDPKVTLN